jgi:hypothetical protein
MEAREQDTAAEELTARMHFKLAVMAFQKSVRRVRSDEPDDFVEFRKLHNRQQTAGGGRVSGQ